jgi:pentatricopeptide repeat protein
VPPSQNRGTRHEAYLEGRHHWNTRTPAGYLKAVECFERLVSEDERMAPAWAALAECYAMAHGVTTVVRADSRNLAIAAAQRALALDSTLAEAHVVLGFVRAAHDFDWRSAETHFRTALDLKPGLAFGHLLYSATVLAPMGRLDQAAAHQACAEALDPLSAVVVSATGMMRLAQRQHDLAARAFRAALDLDPTYPWAHRGLGEVHLLEGRPADAVRALTSVEMPSLAGGLLGWAYARLGRADEARQLLRRMETSGPPPASCQIAVLHLGLEDRAGAIEWLERACSDRSVGIAWLKVDPIWDTLREEPRFRRLLDTLGVGPD